MKKRILTFGVLLILVIFSVVPGVVLSADTTVISGTLAAGYSFEAPNDIILFMGLGTDKGSSTPAGSLVGNNPAGYTVTGADTKATNTGYMTTSGGTPLGNKFEISDEDANYVPADTGKTFVDTSGPTDEYIELYVRQLVEYDDTPGDYSIVITFTITEK